MKFKLFIITLALVVFSTIAFATPYYFRRYTVENGLSYNSVICSIQDKTGFLWFGTRDGLNRFDGYSFKVFTHDGTQTTIGNNSILSLHEDDQGILWVGTQAGLYKYDASTESFSLLKGTSLNEIRCIQSDKNGNLWYISDLTLCKYHAASKKTTRYDTGKYFQATSICFTKNKILWVSTPAGFIQRYNPRRNSFTGYNVFIHSKGVANNWIETLYDTGRNGLLIGTSNQGAKHFNTRLNVYRDIITANANGTGLYVRNFVQRTANEYWLATESGIFIYNSETGTINNLKKEYNNPYSLSDNAVYTLCKDKEGGIFAGTYFGGVNYSPKQNILFEKSIPENTANSLSGNVIREICKDKEGNLWIGTEDAGLNKYDPRKNKYTHYYPTNTKNGISNTNIHALLINGDHLWIGTYEGGLNVLNTNTGEVVKHYYAGAGNHELKSNFIISLYKTRAGQIFIGTWAGAYLYNEATDDFTRISTIPFLTHISNIIEDTKGQVWFSSSGEGVYCYNPLNHTTYNYKVSTRDKNSLSSNIVNSAFEDSSKNLWFATENGGLCKFDTVTATFKSYTTTNGFPSNFIFKVLEDGHRNLWVTTSKGLVCFNPVNNDVKIFTKANGLLSDQFNYNSAYKDGTGKMYFGSVNGLISFNPDHFRTNNFVPPVRITGFQVDNKELVIDKNSSPLNRSITYTRYITLHHDESSFSLNFAALSYTAPEMTMYAYKLDGVDRDWVYLKTNRKVYFTKVLPGTYTFLVKAANSSGLWNNKETILIIEIMPPFYLSIWALIIYSILGVIAFFLLIKNYHRRTEQKNKRKIEILETEMQKEIYQAKIEFFTHITHEIRTPLTLIKGPLEKVKITDDMATVKSNVTIMEKHTNRLLALTNQLLDFRKTEIKGFSLNFVKVDIAALLVDNYINFKSSAQQKGLDYRLKPMPEPIHVFADPEALNKIFSNLLNNAVKYADGFIAIELSSDTDTVCIQITNDGPLIPAEMKQKIFEPFYRIAITSKQTGTGIGLALARSLVEQHNGTLEMKDKSEPYNTFLLTLPVHQAKEFILFEDQQDEIHQEDLLQEDIAFSNGKVTVLLVEDNRDIQSFIASELSTKYKILTAFNGESAIRLLDIHHLDLIVSDVMMPLMDGFELCRVLKDNINYSHIPIILLTAKSTLQDKITGLETGADAYIEKPFSPEHLAVQIANLLDNRSRIKEHFASSPLVHIKTMAYSKADENFLEKLNTIILNNISDSRLDVDKLADEMNMSRTSFFRKIKAISNLSPNELINIARLKKAASLIAEGNYKIYEVAEMIGFNSQSNFARNFHKQFNMSPTEYKKNIPAI